MVPLLRLAFFALLVRPVVFVLLGLNIRHRERLPDNGPAIIVANHNSHLDTLVLMSLLPLRRLPLVRPVAAADYFLSNKMLAWFSTHIIGILPITRNSPGRQIDPLQDCQAALGRGEILILFPEGSRGEPERVSRFKSGVARLQERCAEVPIFPVFLHGLGKALPRGEGLLVPFFCDVFVGDAIPWQGTVNSTLHAVETALSSLSEEGGGSAWD